MIEMKKEFVFSHCAISKSLTQILNTSCRDFVPAEFIGCEFLNVRRVFDDIRIVGVFAF